MMSNNNDGNVNGEDDDHDWETDADDNVDDGDFGGADDGPSPSPPAVAAAARAAALALLAVDPDDEPDVVRSPSNIIANRSSSPPPSSSGGGVVGGAAASFAGGGGAFSVGTSRRSAGPAPAMRLGVAAEGCNDDGDGDGDDDDWMAAGRRPGAGPTTTTTMRRRRPPPLALVPRTPTTRGTPAVAGGSHPLPAYCRFVPGGVAFLPANAKSSSADAEEGEEGEGGNASWVVLSPARPPGSNKKTADRSDSFSAGLASSSGGAGGGAGPPALSPRGSRSASPRNPKPGGSGKAAPPPGGIDTSPSSPGTTTTAASAAAVIRRALLADASLREHALRYYRADVDAAMTASSAADDTAPWASLGHRLPSLSVLANAALVNPLTSVPASCAAEWAESMIMEYMDGRIEEILASGGDGDDGDGDGDDDIADADGDVDAGVDYERMSLKRMRIEFETRLPRDGDDEDVVGGGGGGGTSRALLRRAVLSAWAQEEATTGRTPTNNGNAAAASTARTISDAPLSGALTMEFPTLRGLLKACWRVQRGQEEAVSSSSSGPSAGNDGVCSASPRPPGGGAFPFDFSSGGGGLRHASCAYEGGPCGYVFRRGDIAWNCRTCQTDATCVLCDACFRESDHVGHEVFFHRTTPGGCCDCGDLEAWNAGGMCGRHRPPTPPAGGDDGAEGASDGVGGGDEGVWGVDDDLEAVRAAQRARLEHDRSVDGAPPSVGGGADPAAEPRPLPPRLAAAMSVVIGSVVQSVLSASEGSAIGADASQWRLRWADEICRLWNGASEDEEYYGRSAAMLAAAAAAGRSSTIDDDGGKRVGGEGGGGGGEGCGPTPVTSSIRTTSTTRPSCRAITASSSGCTTTTCTPSTRSSRP